MRGTVRDQSKRFAARVIATYGRTSLLEGEDGATWSAVRRGRRADLVVGDRIVAIAAAAGQATVESIEPRRSLLYRADAFRTKELAANIDRMLLVFASRPSFNLWFLWKALVAARAAEIEAIVVRNKTDLDDGAATAQATLDQIASLGWRTLALSARAQPGHALAALREITQGAHCLLVGQSGMGKSTLLNLLAPEAQARTREYSEHLDHGKQTTTAARWFTLPGGGAIIDTPGFQEFGLAHLSVQQRLAGFPEFEPYLGRCRFLDCRHLVEPDCAIRAAVTTGAIVAARYDFYRALSEDSQR
jgi:ribosome biogenesis GTPase